MSTEYLALLTLFLSFMLFVIQRTEPKKRRFVIFIMFIPALLLRNFVVYRDIESEGWTALFLSLVLNFLFWVLIGRYNPVKSSDEIQVLGLDD
jgi:hypothetical protein